MWKQKVRLAIRVPDRAHGFEIKEAWGAAALVRLSLVDRRTSGIRGRGAEPHGRIATVGLDTRRR